jgi:hypothetical protein
MAASRSSNRSSPIPSWFFGELQPARIIINSGNSPPSQMARPRREPSLFIPIYISTGRDVIVTVGLKKNYDSDVRRIGNRRRLSASEKWFDQLQEYF